MLGAQLRGHELDQRGTEYDERRNKIFEPQPCDLAAADKSIGLLDYEDSPPNADGLGKTYFYSAASTGCKVLTRTVHCFYEGNPTSGTDYETRYYTDSYYLEQLRAAAGHGAGFP